MLARRDPFREMMTLRNAMDRLFENAFVGPTAEWSQSTTWDLPLDVSETADEFVVKASIPGVNPDDLEITYNANTLTIRGEIKADEEVEGTQVHFRERRFGSFTRSISLPTSIDANAIEAKYDAGVLTLHLPKSQEAKPKRIQIQSGGQKELEGSVVKPNNGR